MPLSAAPKSGVMDDEEICELIEEKQKVLSSHL